VTTDEAGPYLRVLDELVPAAAHVTEQYGNNRIEADHARLKARLRPMRGLKRLRSAARIAAGHAFVRNLRRGHYELATEAEPRLRLATHSSSSHRPCDRQFFRIRYLPSGWTQQTPVSSTPRRRRLRPRPTTRWAGPQVIADLRRRDRQPTVDHAP
jgi:DDE domain